MYHFLVSIRFVPFYTVLDGTYGQNPKTYLSLWFGFNWTVKANLMRSPDLCYIVTL